MKLPLLLTVAAFALASTTTHAATITWGAPTGISGDADVRANGILVGAFNIDGPSAPATTINGVPFAPFTFSGNVATVGNFTFTSPVPFASSFFGLAGPNPFGSLSPQYRALLGTYGRNFSESFTLTMNHLTVGDRLPKGFGPASPKKLEAKGTALVKVKSPTVATVPENVNGAKGTPLIVVAGAEGPSMLNAPTRLPFALTSASPEMPVGALQVIVAAWVVVLASAKAAAVRRSGSFIRCGGHCVALL